MANDKNIKFEQLVRATVASLRESPTDGTPAPLVVDHPAIQEVIDTATGAMLTVLSERTGIDYQDSRLRAVEQSVMTDFNNDLRNFLEEWIDTYLEDLENPENDES